jgi:hypothetical protein
LVVRAQKNGQPDEADTGERWGCLIQDRPSRFIVAAAAGRIGEPLITEAVAQAADRTNQAAFAWCSDGWQGYRHILTEQYRRPLATGKRGRPRRVLPEDVQLTQTIKHRDEHGHLVSIETRATLGDLVAVPGTVHVERFNGALRDRLAALTRKTHAFAKRDATWDALLTLQIFEHNWLRAHIALRLPLSQMPPRYTQRSPAMALGLTDHIWSWLEFLTSPVLHHP